MFYGIDIQTRKELIAANNTVEEIREMIGADSLTFLSEDGLVDAIGRPYEGNMAVYVWLILMGTIQQLFMIMSKSF